MTPFLGLFIADVAVAGNTVGQPLFGNLWLAFLAVVGGIAIFLLCVALLGRWLSATHPDPLPQPVVLSPPLATTEISPEITAVIAASVATVLGSRTRIAAVKLESSSTTPSIEVLMQQWSMEGRRQIYSSHKVR